MLRERKKGEAFGHTHRSQKTRRQGATEDTRVQHTPSQATQASTQAWAPTRMTPLIREVLRRKLLGQSQREIAAAIRKTPQWVGLVCRSPLFRLELARMEEKLSGRFTAIQQEAMEVDARIGALDIVADVATSAEKDATRLAAAQAILDRAYGKATQPVALSLGFSIPEEFLDRATREFFRPAVEVEAAAAQVPGAQAVEDAPSE